ncbi:MAG: YlxR family protein [Nocardioides sp.]|uniref:YlxR family protein n=1 Tax=Nocardioides sp. TaxID=35761 RepID=UPI003F059E07
MGCRVRAAKSDLLRVVAGVDQQGRKAVLPDAGATAPGRGAYVHPTPECVDNAIRRRALNRALRAGEALDTQALTDRLPLIHSP